MFGTLGTSGMAGNIKNIWCKVDDERLRGRSFYSWAQACEEMKLNSLIDHIKKKGFQWGEKERVIGYVRYERRRG